MIERPPRLGSKRFRTIAKLALAADPVMALKSLYWFITRRRLRGWSRLLVTASNRELSYRRWIEAAEPRLFDAFQTTEPPPRPSTFVVLVLGEDSKDAAATLDSVRNADLHPVAVYCDAFPDEAEILPAECAGDLARALTSLAARHSGAWLLPLSAGDRLSTEAGAVLAASIPGADRHQFVYWDEDAIGANGREDPWVKPDWSPTLFGQLGGLSGAAAIPLLDPGHWETSPTPECRLPLSRRGIDQLLLGLAARCGWEARHLPLVLTHRGRSTRLPERLPVPAAPTVDRWPLVSVLVPTRDQPELLASCLDGIDRARYAGGIELVLIDNGTVDPGALARIEAARAKGAKVVRDEGPFNFSRLNNLGSRHASGECLCFLNNDVEPVNDDWLSHMVAHALRPGVGAVGAQLLYPSGEIQHAGVCIGLGGAAGHVQKLVAPDEARFRTWHQATREVSAVTAAALVIRKAAFDDIGGFDETLFPVAFNDVDLCLRLGAQGLRNLYVAQARLIHHESKSRGDDYSPQHRERFAREVAALQGRWRTQTFADPYFSPLFSRLVERCVLTL